MAKKSKNKKPTVVTSVEDISTPVNKSFGVISADSGRVPTPGVLPEGYDLDASDLPQVDVPLPEALPAVTPEPDPDAPYGAVFFSTPSAKSEVDMTLADETDLRGQVAVDAAKATDAQILTQTKQDGPANASELVGKIRELVPGSMEVNDDPVTSFREGVVSFPSELAMALVRKGTKEWSGRTMLSERDKISIGVVAGNFTPENLQQLLPADYGFQTGSLYIFAYSAERYSAGDMLGWLDSNITWEPNARVDLVYINHATEREHLRKHREKALLEDRVVIAVEALPLHCMATDPAHVPHSQEADGVFVYTGTELIRNKLRTLLDVRALPSSASL